MKYVILFKYLLASNQTFEIKEREHINSYNSIKNQNRPTKKKNHLVSILKPLFPRSWFKLKIIVVKFTQILSYQKC